MSNTFKVGDKVRFKATERPFSLSNGRTIRPGDTAVVLASNSWFLDVRMDKDCHTVPGIYASRWEKIEETKPAFKVGDKVRFKATNQVIGRGYASETRPGDTGTVVGAYLTLSVKLDRSGVTAAYTPGCWEKVEDVRPAQETPQRKFIVSLYENGKYRPASEPKTYDSPTQATKVAEEMSRKHVGKTFVVLQALSTSYTQPTPTVTTKAL